MKKFLIVASFVFVFAFSAFPVLAKSENANGSGKVDICHREGETGLFHLINVSVNAKPAHMRHGDGLPGELVPEIDDKKFAMDCSIIDIWQLIDTVTVDSTKPEGNNSTILQTGEQYKFIVSGQWQGSYVTFPNAWVDAEYTTQDGWTTHSDGVSTIRLNQGDLMINNAFVEWGSYDTNHTYTYFYSPSLTGSVNFSVFDGNASGVKEPTWYGDNFGNLTVKIYSQ